MAKHDCALREHRIGVLQLDIRSSWSLYTGWVGSGSNPYKKPPRSKCNALVEKTRADRQKLNVEQLIRCQYTLFHRSRIFDFVLKMVSNRGPFEKRVVFSTPKPWASLRHRKKSEKSWLEKNPKRWNNVYCVSNEGFIRRTHLRAFVFENKSLQTYWQIGQEFRNMALRCIGDLHNRWDAWQATAVDIKSAVLRLVGASLAAWP